MTCLAAVVVFGVTYALVLPAITMTGKYPVLSAETLTAWTGDEIAVKVSVEADTMDGGRIVVLTLEGEGADLSASYAFNEEGVCVITDEEQKEIELHRAVREGTKNTVDYWFALEPGDQTVFTLNLADEVDVTRFAETMEAVRQSSDEAEAEAEKATASDAGKSAAVAKASSEKRDATASNAEKASVSNADVAEANKIAAEKDEEKILTESDENGFVEILDGAIINDLEGEDEEDGEATEIIAELKVSAGIAADYEKAVKDAEKNADKRGNAQLKFKWKDVVVTKASAPDLVAYVNGATIAVFCDENSGIPADAVLSVEEILEGTPEYEEYLAQTKSAVANATDSNAAKSVTHARFFDITILDADGSELEPETPAKVVITYDESIKLEDDGDLNVAHLKEDAPELLKPGTLEKSGSTDKSKDISGLSFTADSFSVYAVFGTETLTTKYLASNGDTYSITVTCPPESGIPSDAHLEVREILEGDAEYEEYAARTAAALSNNAESMNNLRLFDISILSAAGTKLEPAAQVDVKIEYVNPIEIQDQTVSVVHFGEKKTEVIDPSILGKREGTADEFTFAAKSFSIYAIVTYGVTENLNGKTLAIVKVSNTAVKPVGSNNQYVVYYGAALQASADPDNANRMQGLNVVVDPRTHNKYIVTGTSVPTTAAQASNQSGWSSTADVDLWTFELVSGTTNQYYIKASSGQYLTLTPANGVALSDTAQALTVTAVAGTTASGSQRVTISGGEGDDIRYLCSQYTDATGNPSAATSYFWPGQTSSSSLSDTYKMTLCEVRPADYSSGDEYSGQKISVQDIKDFLEDTSPYLVYKSVFNQKKGEYETYVIDGKGNLVYAYEKGDAIALYSTVSPLWNVVFCDTAGYYIFKNTQTGKCLRPTSDGYLVCELSDFTTQVPGVQLPGRNDGSYNSGISYWNDSVNAYRGYKIVENAGDMSLQVAVPADAMEFSFAKVTTETSGLHPVETVDSVAAGITMHMFDYDDTATQNNVTHAKAWQANTLRGSRIAYKLTNGIPAFNTSDTNPHASPGATTATVLFSPTSQYYRGDANRLFLKDTYESTGYYEYVSFNNYAYWNGPPRGATTPAAGGTYDFTVYEEVGTSGRYASAPTSFTHQIGEFYPYNRLSEATTASYRSLYGGGSIQLDYEDPTYSDQLHEVIPITGDTYSGSTVARYNFGMTMDFKFMMPENGLINGEPMVYEFNGDDDLYVFVDDVLLLDIGGIHDAWPGNIDFASGQIVVEGTSATIEEYSDRNTTIKQAFRRAGVFPDGKPWVEDETQINKYFKGDTFADFTGHTFKMFYMEHGKNASNLEMRFNIPVVESGQFTVKKELMGTDQSRYANVPFAFKAYKLLTALDEGYVSGKDTYKPITTDAIYGMKVGNDGVVVDVSAQKIPIPFEEGTDVFYLKPGETAIFTQPEHEVYYVEELGIGATFHQLYPRVFINNTKVDENEGVYRCADDTVINRPLVTFRNECSTIALNDLHITKALDSDSIDNGDMFEYRLLLENTAGTLWQYSTGIYYILDSEGWYCEYVNGEYVRRTKDREAAETNHYYTQAGEYGSMNRIPPGYTIEVRDLLAGTHFYVDEIRVNEKGEATDAPLITESGWDLVNRTRVNADEPLASMSNASVFSYFKSGEDRNDTIANLTADQTDKEQGRGYGVIGRIQQDGSDGQRTAEVTFTNKAGRQIKVRKVWGSDEGFVDTHGSVWVALFTGSGENLTYVPDTKREITPQTGEVVYNVADIGDYTVREVIVKGDTVTPIDEGGKIVVTGEGTQIGTGKDDTYFAAYSTSTASDALVREDTVTNTMYPLYLRKVDPNGNALQGAIFQLTDGQGAVVPGYESFESGEDGVLLNNAYLSNGTYYLEEIKAPDGFIKLPVKIAITVSDGEAVYTAISTDRTAPRTYENATDSDAAYEFVIDNNPGTELPSTGGPGTALYTLSGLMLLITSALLYGFRRRHEERRSA